MDKKAEFVTAGLEGNAADAASAFNDLMLDKIGGVIDQVRVQTAQTLFNTGTEVDGGNSES